MPDISVIIPCYRQAHFLPQALESVLEGHPDVEVEVVVVDDGSPDDVRGVVSRYPTVTLVSQENAGLSAARNAGILASRGPLLLFLDSDDYVRPRMLTRAVAFVAQHPEVDVAHGRAHVVSGTDPQVVTTFGGEEPGDDALHRLLRKNIGPPNTFVVRRAALARSGMFDPSLRSCEDWDLWIRLAATKATFALVPEMYSVYRVTEGSMSTNLERMWTSGAGVLRRSRSLHVDCRECSTSAVAGRRQFAEGLWALTRAGLSARATAARTIRVMISHPVLAWWQLRARVLG